MTILTQESRNLNTFINNYVPENWVDPIGETAAKVSIGIKEYLEVIMINPNSHPIDKDILEDYYPCVQEACGEYIKTKLMKDELCIYLN